MKSQPVWLSKEQFPFTSHWVNIDGSDMHYIDEGKGKVVLFVHGTPEWSFGFRNLIKELRKNFRCIAMDHIGFGLSDKPTEGDYSCVAHATRLNTFIRYLDLQNFSIVANDFGGGIAMNFALNNVNAIHRIILFNTWMWSLENDKHFSTPSRLMQSLIGRFLYLRLNASVNLIMPSSYGNRRNLTDEIHRHFKQALPDVESRRGVYALTGELMRASSWWETLWNKLNTIESERFLVFWGMKDKFVPVYALAKWQTGLPNAKFICYDDAGHFVHEERPGDMIAAIRKFVN